MLPEIAEALKPREEVIEFAGRKLVARELASAAKLPQGGEDLDAGYRMMVACIYLEDGTPALEEADLPALKAAGSKRIAPLMEAVMRVNGLDATGEAGKSEAGPG